MIVSCDYSVRKFAESKNYTGALVDKFRAKDFNCCCIAAISGKQCAFCDVSRCYALTHYFFTNSIPLMPNLKFLDVSWTSINNVECITDCLVLRGLNLSGTTQIPDYTGLSALTTLHLLSLRASNVDTIEFCSALLELRSLDVGYTAVNDLSPLSGLTRLEELLLDHSGSKSRALMLKNGFSWDEYLMYTTVEIVDAPSLSGSAADGDGDVSLDGSVGVNGIAVEAHHQSGRVAAVSPSSHSQNQSQSHSPRAGSQPGETDDDGDDDRDLSSQITHSSTRSVPLSSGFTLEQAEALEDTDQQFIVSNLQYLSNITQREHANLRVINAAHTELGDTFYDSCVNAVHEDVCLEKRSVSHKLVVAIVNNDVDAARRYLQSGVYINERVGPWINDFFADIWHSVRGGADIPEVKSYGGFVGTPSQTTRDKRIPGSIPFFNCNHEDIFLRPTYVHIAIVFNAREILQLLVTLGAELSAEVWFSYICIDVDNIVTTDAAVRCNLELQNHGPLKESAFIFNPHSLAKEVAEKVVHRHTEGFIAKKVSNFKKLCNYFCEVMVEILNGNSDKPPAMPEIRLTSGAGTADSALQSTANGNSNSNSDSLRPSTTSNIPSFPAIGDTMSPGAKLSTSNSNKNMLSVSASSSKTDSLANKQTDRSKKSTAVVAVASRDDESLASSDWSRMVGITLEADESVADAFPGGADDTSVVTRGTINTLATSNTNDVMDASKSGIAIKNVNTAPVSLFPGHGDDDDSVGTATSDFSVSSSVMDLANPGKRPKRVKKKQAKNKVDVIIDVKALQERISCLFWRNHDMVVKLTSTVEHIPMDFQVMNTNTKNTPMLSNQQYISTKSGKIVTILGVRSYFLENKADVIAHAASVQQDRWDQLDADRFANTLIFDGKLGLMRKIKPKPEPDLVRKAKFEDDIAHIHEKRLESMY